MYIHMYVCRTLNVETLNISFLRFGSQLQNLANWQSRLAINYVVSLPGFRFGSVWFGLVLWSLHRHHDHTCC